MCRGSSLRQPPTALSDCAGVRCDAADGGGERPDRDLLGGHHSAISDVEFRVPSSVQPLSRSDPSTGLAHDIGESSRALIARALRRARSRVDRRVLERLRRFHDELDDFIPTMPYAVPGRALAVTVRDHSPVQSAFPRLNVTTKRATRALRMG
jgi:hypothetical protein